MNSHKKTSWLSRAQNLGLTYKEAFILILLTLMSTASEILGLGIFLPIFQFIRMDGDLDALVEESGIWQNVIDIFSYFSVEVSLALLLFLSFLFFLIRQIFTFLRMLYNAVVKQRLVQKQRNYVFSNYIGANTSYHDNIHVGSLLNIVQTEVDRAVGGIMTPLELLVYLVMCAGYLIMLSSLSLSMTFLSVFVFIVVGFIPRVWIIKSKNTGRKLVKANTIMSEFLVSRLKSPRLIRLSGTEEAEREEFYRLTLSQRKHNVLSVILKTKTETIMEPIIIGLSLVLLYLAHTVLYLQIEIIGLYLVIAMRLMPIVKSILMQIQSIQNVLGSMEALEERIKTMIDSLEVDNGRKTLASISNFILINKVSYRYPNTNVNALTDITLKIESNKTTSIVGPSGSGKSTLIDLLPRLRLPTKGEIKIDGININEYRLSSIRSLLSYVPQTPQIFSGSVKNHILYGKKSATDKEIEKAIELAGAKDFVNNLPLGINTELGDDAIKLSGGQRQRIDLARALVKNAPILILDEPTSSLDATSEENFMEVISAIRQKTKTTIIIVTHSLPSISTSDLIVVLNNGRIESMGTHYSLLKEKGWYSKAWRMQSPK